MAVEPLTLIGHRLTPIERRDWRLLAAIGGALLLLFAYALPFFGQRIVSATITFSGGTVLEQTYTFLPIGQHFAQAKNPSEEQLTSIKIDLEPVEGFSSTGYGWLVGALNGPESLWRLASFAITLALPLVGAIIALVLVGRAWWSNDGLPESLLPHSIRLALLTSPSLILAWFHQFDFATNLIGLSQGALWPRPGFYVALIASIVMCIGLYGLRRQTRHELVNWWALVFAVAFLIWLLVRMRPYPFLEIWLFISDGILVTLRIVTTSFGFILLVSLLGGLGRISHNRIIYGIASLYVEIIRGIPLLVQLLFIWFALPQVFKGVGTFLLNVSELKSVGEWLINLRLNPFTAAVLGLTICYGAYGAEIFRAGISSIHHGQMEAARSLGMTYVQAMRYVILPQAVRVILPPIGNEFVALLKDSSLVSVLAVSDLTRRGREYMSRTFLSFDTWIMVALCYLVLTLFSSRAVEFIESKMRFER